MGVCLEKRDGILCLVSDDGQSMHGDFARLLPRLKHNNLTHELIVKAAKIKDAGGRLPLAIDATAGMGDDALLLAAAGFKVKLFERDETIAALLKDTIRRALEDEELASIVSRMELIEADSIEGMSEIAEYVDVVLLDPMFPQRTKSAMVKKKFQLIHNIEEPCQDENALMEAALATGAHKILVKRPAKGPYLAGIKPSYSLEGKAVRVDVIVRA